MATLAIYLERDADLPPIVWRGNRALNYLMDAGAPRTELRLGEAWGPLAGRLIAYHDGQIRAGEGIRLKKGLIARGSLGSIEVGSNTKPTTLIHVEATDDEARATLAAIPAEWRDWVSLA